MSTSTAAAPPASMGADGPNAPEEDATGVLAGVTAAAEVGAAAAGVAVAVPGVAETDGLADGRLGVAAAVDTDGEGEGDFPAASGNTTSEQE